MAKPAMHVRQVKSKEDRKRPSVFIRLKTDDSFRAFALFEPDPELSDNPGFYEYFSHWDQQGGTYVPCAGKKCPFCLANDNPATQAMTLWYFPENDKKEQLKVFTMNFSTTQDITDIAEEDDGILGKKFRIVRKSDKGDYRIRPLSDKALTKAQIKELLGAAPNLPDMVDRQLAIQWERLKAQEAMADEEDEDEDEDEEEPRARRGQPADEADENEDEDEEEDEDEDEDEDEEEEEDEDEEEEEEESEDEEEESEDQLEGMKFEVIKGDEDNEVIDAKDSDGDKTKLFVGEGLEPEWNVIKKGVTITVDAIKDDEGDWVMTDLKVSKPRGGKTKGKAKAAK